jgi:hypothetical protein
VGREAHFGGGVACIRRRSVTWGHSPSSLVYFEADFRRCANLRQVNVSNGNVPTGRMQKMLMKFPEVLRWIA